MAQYQYKENKLANIMNIIGGIIPILLWFFIAFFVKDFTNLPNGMGIPKQFVTPFQIILIILLLFIPMSNLSRRFRQNSIKVITNRKGLTVSISGIEKKFSWHELTNSLVIYGYFPYVKNNKDMIPRKLILKKAPIQGQIQPGDIIEIDNNPYGMSFPDMQELINEIRKNEPKIKQEVIGVENYCPHCKIKINNNICKKCEGNIKMVPRYQKLFYTTKFSAILLTVLLFLTGSKLLCILGIVVAIPFVFMLTFIAYRKDQIMNQNNK